MRTATFTRDELVAAVSVSRSFSEVLRRLNLKPGGGSQARVKKLAVELELDFSHFKGQAWHSGEIALNRKTADEIFGLLPEGSNRAPAYLLRRALLDSGVPLKCELCPLVDEWNGLPIVLEVDHRDGNRLNNMPDNLRFLCPNCHSQQTETNRPWKKFVRGEA